jgi:hypothetical protein
MTFEEWWDENADDFMEFDWDVVAKLAWQAATKRAIGIARDTVATNYAWNDACYEIETAIRGENDKD